MTEQEILERLEGVYQESRQMSETTSQAILLAKTDRAQQRFIRILKRLIPERVKFVLKKVLIKLYQNR